MLHHVIAKFEEENGHNRQLDYLYVFDKYTLVRRYFGRVEGGFFEHTIKFSDEVVWQHVKGREAVWHHIGPWQTDIDAALRRVVEKLVASREAKEMEKRIQDNVRRSVEAEKKEATRQRLVAEYEKGI